MKTRTHFYKINFCEIDDLLCRLQPSDLMYIITQAQIRLNYLKASGKTGLWRVTYMDQSVYFSKYEDSTEFLNLMIKKLDAENTSCNFSIRFLEGYFAQYEKFLASSSEELSGLRLQFKDSV